MLGRVLALSLLFLSQLITQCEVQGRTFQWKFGNNFVQTDLEECQMLPIIVSPLDGSNSSAVGIPPYYLLAFEAGGIPTITSIGSDPQNLTWQVNHARGSALMLTVLDSNTTGVTGGPQGNTGGQAPSFFNVTAGSSTSCIPSKPSTSLATIQSNSTGSLATCQPWVLTVSGGQQPYTIVLSALDSGVITPILMGNGNDVLVWPDRADPGGDIMASVIDANGQWGYSTSAVHTQGSTNVDCTGEVTHPETLQQLQQERDQEQAAERAAMDHQHSMLIVKAVVGTLVPILVIAAAVAFFWWRRRKLRLDRDRGVWDGQDISVRAWESSLPPPPADMAEVGHATSPTSADSKTLSFSSSAGATGGLSAVPFLPSSNVVITPSPAPTSPSPGASNSGSYPFSSSIQNSASPARTLDPGRHRKALEARSSASHLDSSRTLLSTQTSMTSLRTLPSSPYPRRNNSPLPPGALPPLAPGASVTTASPLDPSDIQPDIIIQHRDGGSTAVVQELPPPYADRSGLNSNP